MGNYSLALKLLRAKLEEPFSRNNSQSPVVLLLKVILGMLSTDLPHLVLSLHSSRNETEILAYSIAILSLGPDPKRKYNLPFKQSVSADSESPKKDKKRKRSRSYSRSESDRKEKKKDKKDKDKKDKKDKDRERSREKEKEKYKEKGENEYQLVTLYSVLLKKTLQCPGLASCPLFKHLLVYVASSSSNSSTLCKEEMQRLINSLRVPLFHDNSFRELCSLTLKVIYLKSSLGQESELSSQIEDELIPLKCTELSKQGKSPLALTRVLDRICRALDHMGDDMQHHSDNLLTSGWWDVFCLDISKFCAGRMLDTEEEKLFEAIVGRLGGWAYKGLEKLSRGLALLKKNKVIKGNENESITDTLCELLKHKLRDLSYEMSNAKYNANGKGKPTGEASWGDWVEESRERAQLWSAGWGEDYSCTLLQAALWSLQQIDPTVLIESHAFDPLQVCLARSFDTLQLAQTPLPSLLGQKLLPERNPKLYTLLALKISQMVLTLFENKFSILANTRLYPGEYFNVNFLSLCTRLYTATIRISTPLVAKIKQNVDGLIEKIIRQISLYRPNPNSDIVPFPADRVLSHLLKQILTSTTPFKALTILELYLTSASHQLPSPILLTKTPSHPLPLLSFSVERSPQFLGDSMLSGESVMGQFLNRLIKLADQPAHLVLIQRILGHVVSRGGEPVVQEVVKTLESIGKKIMKREEDGLDRFFVLLIRLAKDPVWKGLAIDSHLWMDLLEGVQKKIEAKSEEGLKLLGLYLEFASIMVSRKWGMQKELEEKDSKGGDYLFEDLPKESLLQRLVEKVDKIVLPYLEQATLIIQTNLPSQNLLSLALHWATFFQSMAESVIGQILLLYSLYTRQVESMAKPLASLGPLITFFLTGIKHNSKFATENEQFTKGLGSLLACIRNLLIYPSSNQPRKSASRVAAIDKLLKVCTITQLTEKSKSVYSSGPSSLEIQLLAISIESMVSEVSSEFDEKANPPYKNNRDFAERHRKWLKAVEAQEDNNKSKMFKKLLVVGKFGELIRVLIGRMNGEVREGRLEEDWIGKQEVDKYLASDDKLEDKPGLIQNGSSEATEITVSYVTGVETESKKEASKSLWPDPEAFRELNIPHSYRLAECKSFQPPERTTQPSPRNQNTHKISSSRPSSTHLDSFTMGGEALSLANTVHQQPPPPKIVIPPSSPGPALSVYSTPRPSPAHSHPHPIPLSMPQPQPSHPFMHAGPPTPSFPQYPFYPVQSDNIYRPTIPLISAPIASNAVYTPTDTTLPYSMPSTNPDDIKRLLDMVKSLKSKNN
jgi:hypothetical protein